MSFNPRDELAEVFAKLSTEECAAALNDLEFLGNAFVMMRSDGTAVRIDPVKVQMQVRTNPHPSLGRLAREASELRTFIDGDKK